MAGRVAYSQLDGTDLHWSIDLNQLGAFDREDRDNVPWVKCLGEHVSFMYHPGSHVREPEDRRKKSPSTTYQSNSPTWNIVQPKNVLDFMIFSF